MAGTGPDPIDLYVGATIRMRRKKLDMPQAVLGGRIGVSFQQIQKYENGANRVSASMLVRIAEALGASILELLPPASDLKADDEFTREFARDQDNRPLVVAWEQLDLDQRREVLSLVLGLAQKNAGVRRRPPEPS